MAVPAWSSRLIAELHAADERAEALARSLSEAQLNWKPSPQQWSVGQCLEHLADARVLDRFLDGNRATRDLIARGERYDVNRIRFKNPFVPLLRFTVGTGFEIISKHASRHLLQAERVRSAPGFPAS